MKRKSSRKAASRICSYLLTAAMVVTGLTLSPITTVEVQAAATTKNVNLNVGNSIAGIGNPTSGTNTSATSWAGTTVYYGNKAYYVLDKDGNQGGHSSMADHMLLLSKGVLEASGRNFDTSSSDWSISAIRTALNGSGFYDGLTSTEKGAISKTTISSGNTRDDYNVGYPSTSTDDHIFLLDLHDVQNTNYGFNTNDGTRQAADPNCVGYWWLRSPGYNDERAASVNNNGFVNSVGDEMVPVGTARPAFNLNLSSVLFTSASGASKSDFAATGDAPISGASNYNTWNMTLKDSNTAFSAKRMTAGSTLTAGSSVEVKVTDLGTAGTGVTYSQISAMLVDGNNTVLAYGKISGDSGAATGTYTVNIPSDVTTANKLYVFAEDVSSSAGSNMTDYASNMVDVTTKSSAPIPHHNDSNNSDNNDSNSGGSSNPKEEAYVNPLVWYYEANPIGSLCLIEHQGPMCVAAFNAATPNGYKEAFSFNLLLAENGLFKASHVKKYGKFVLNFPKEWQKPGRKFILIGIDKFGNTKTFSDMDLSDETFTTMLDVDGYAFSLIYID